jgi:ubiquinone/menaquinone biosynthesis C-methylase UbiE
MRVKMTGPDAAFAGRLVARELLDDPVDSLDELQGALRDIELANAWFGGAAPVREALDRIEATQVLDVGTGSADIPHALVRRAARRGVELSITCLDRSEQVLAIARQRTRGHPGLHFVSADGGALPFDDRAFDVAMCNLALHHFDPEPAIRLLAELRRVSRLTPLVCDLRRTVPALTASYLFSRLVSNNRLTRHDAPLSVRRAYTPSEALRLAHEAGWRRAVVRTHPFFRMAMTDE